MSVLLEKKYYQILCIEESSTLEELKKAYRIKAKQLHPDRNKAVDAHENFIELNEAYEYLYNKMNDGVYDFNRSTYTKASSYYTTYGDWQRKEKEKARARANYYASMKYHEFIRSDFYKTAVALHNIVDHLMLLVVFFIIIGIPVIGVVVEGIRGLLGSIFVLLLLAPVAVYYLRNSAPFSLKGFISSVIIIGKTRTAIFILSVILNIFFLMRIGLSTMIQLWLLILFFALTMFLGYLIVRFTSGEFDKYSKLFAIFSIPPGIINLLLIVNFLFSTGPVIEEYNFHSSYYLSQLEWNRTSKVPLENNAYKKYVGIRVFLNYNALRGAIGVKYTFEDGLFGVRVMKAYELIKAVPGSHEQSPD